MPTRRSPYRSTTPSFATMAARSSTVSSGDLRPRADRCAPSRGRCRLGRRPRPQGNRPPARARARRRRRRIGWTTGDGRPGWPSRFTGPLADEAVLRELTDQRADRAPVQAGQRDELGPRCRRVVMDVPEQRREVVAPDGLEVAAGGVGGRSTWIVVSPDKCLWYRATNHGRCQPFSLVIAPGGGSAGGEPRHVVVEPIEDDAIERVRRVDELLQHRHPVAAPDALRVHRHHEQAARRVLPGVAQLGRPDLEDLRRGDEAVLAGVRARTAANRPSPSRPAPRRACSRPQRVPRLVWRSPWRTWDSA